MARHPDIDHGYAWIIMLATFGLQYLQSSIYISFSVLLVEFSDIFDIPKYEAALAGSISMGTTCLSGENNQNRAVIIRGGGGVLALEMGRGVPPACSKPDPVAIRLTAKKTPCPNFEINTEFN